MPEYRTVKNPETLKGTAIEADDENLAGGVDSAIGLDTAKDKPDAQLEIRYRGGNTYVTLAVDDGKGAKRSDGTRQPNYVPQEHWRFAGHISPDDCRTNWKAAQEKATVANKATSENADDDHPDD